MHRKFVSLMVINCFAVAMLSYVAQAEEPASPPAVMIMPKTGMPSRTLRVSMGICSVLNNAKVQKDLELTDDQRVKATAAAKDSSAALDESVTSLSEENPDPAELNEKIGELVRDAQNRLLKKLDEILTPRQGKRLKEIILQSQGSMALLDPDVMKTIEISEDQQKQMNELRDIFQKKMREFAVMRVQSPGPATYPDNAAEMKEKMLKARKALDDTMLQVLTPEQREKFEKMQGAKIELS
jgi:Spy/CpxP family protein refolding chaperone